MTALAGSDPILSCAEAAAVEQRLFGADEGREWAAMQRAGLAIAAAVRRDFGEIGGFPAAGRILILAGKGHNGGDAMIAAQAILQESPNASAEVIFAFGVRALRPLAMRAWQNLNHSAGRRVNLRTVREATAGTGAAPGWDLCLDGVFGFQFRAPASGAVAALLRRVNAWPVRFRAAVDLPSAGLFRADFTYATGSVKAPLLGAPEAGRVRYLDLGFFQGGEDGRERVLTAAVLAPLGAWRDPQSDKRAHGHVMLLGGSRSYPGAILMAVLAALRSGAGLVTAFVPESLAPGFAARAPEAMWVGWPETPAGGLALEGRHLLHERIERASALVMGPGMAREPETLALAAEVAAEVAAPLVLDADALQPVIVRSGRAARIITPHAGEFARLSAGAEPARYAAESGVTLVLKGPVTRIFDGAEGAAYHSFFGGPVLARGGSGDLLAGLIGGLLAQPPTAALAAAARGVVWHGLAADALARTHGAVPVSITQLLDFLPAALRESAACPAS